MEKCWGTKAPDDIALVYVPNEDARAEWLDAGVQLMKLICHRPKSIIAELSLYRKYVPILLKQMDTLTEANKKSAMQIERNSKIEYDRSGKRWSKDEDESLINLVCDGNVNIHELCTAFGRSPGAIKTHISELVGVKRLTLEVAGRFVGIIDGQSAESEIKGTLYKDA